MIPTSAKEQLPFTPVEGGATYQIAVPTLLQRAAYRRDVQASGARYASDADLLALLREGVREVVEESGQGALLDLIDNYEAVAQDREALAQDEALGRDIAELEETIGRHYPPYAQAMADRGHWLAVAPIVAFQHFVRGWDGLEAPCEMKGGKVTDRCLEQVPENDILAVGYKAMALLHPTQDQAKNSPSRSPSPSGREISKAD